MSSSVYFASCAACASSGSSTANSPDVGRTTSGTSHPASVSAIVNSSRIGEPAGHRLAGRKRDGDSVGRWRARAAAAADGYSMRCISCSPCSRVASPAKSPVGEWHLAQPPAPLKYCLPASALPVCRSATSTNGGSLERLRLRLRVVNERDNGRQVRVGQVERRHALVGAPAAHDRNDLVATHVFRDNRRAGEIGPGLTALASRPWQKPHCAAKSGAPA